MPPQHSPRLRSVPSRFGNQIRRYRLALGLTQRQVARRLKVRLSTVSAWERGLTCPATPRLLQLAKLLDTLAEALYPQFYRTRGPFTPER